MTVRIVAIGQSVGDRVGYFLKVNPANTGKFGNLTTLTFLIPVEESDVINKRREMVGYLAENDKTLTCAYDRSDWMTIYVLDKLAFRTRS